MKYLLTQYICLHKEIALIKCTQIQLCSAQSSQVFEFDGKNNNTLPVDVFVRKFSDKKKVFSQENIFYTMGHKNVPLFWDRPISSSVFLSS